MAGRPELPLLVDAPDEAAQTIVVRPSPPGGDASLAIVVRRRPGGAMLVLPRRAVNAEILAENFGPYTDLSLPAADVEAPEFADPALNLDVTAVDVGDDILELITDQTAQPSIGFFSDPATQEVTERVPHGRTLLRSIARWIAEVRTEVGPASDYFTADSEGLGLDEPPGGAPAPEAGARRGRGGRSRGGGRAGRGAAPEEPRTTARPTVAGLAGQLANLEQLLSQGGGLGAIFERLDALETRGPPPADTGATPPGSLAAAPQPQARVPPAGAAGGVLTRAAAQASRAQVAVGAAPARGGLGTGPPRGLGDPVRAPARTSAGGRPPAATGLALLPFDDEVEEVDDELPADGAVGPVVLAALSRQTEALSRLLGRGRGSELDPNLPGGPEEGGAYGPTSAVRGSAQRSRYRRILQETPGHFSRRVQQNMAAALGPRHRGELPDPLVYYERYGSFEGLRTLGLVSYQISYLLEALWTQDFDRAADRAALLAVCLDQAVLDGLAVA